MNQETGSSLYNDARIRRLVARKQRAVFSLAALVLALHFGFVFVMALRPGWLAARFTPEGITTHGMIITFILVLVVFAVMFVFVRRRIAENNADIRDMLDRISNE